MRMWQLVGQRYPRLWGTARAKRIGVFLALVALVGFASIAGRNTASATTGGVLLCDVGSNVGGCVYLFQNTPDLRTQNFNDRASYVSTDYGPFALYSEINYQGRCQTINAWQKVQLTESWVGDNTVSSVRVGPCLATDWTTQKIWQGSSVATGSGDFIGDVKVINGTSSSISCGSGWEKIGTDLNKGAGGAYVYLCVRRTSKPTFDALYAVTGDHPSIIPCKSATHYRVSGNLNERAGGKYIYFCVRLYDRQSDPSPFEATGIWNVQFITINGGISGSVALDMARIRCGLSDFSTLDATDLNKGAGGDWIYTCPVFHNAIIDD